MFSEFSNFDFTEVTNSSLKHEHILHWKNKVSPKIFSTKFHKIYNKKIATEKINSLALTIIWLICFLKGFS